MEELERERLRIKKQAASNAKKQELEFKKLYEELDKAKALEIELKHTKEQ
jgi:hypothetical protein